MPRNNPNGFANKSLRECRDKSGVGTIYTLYYVIAYLKQLAGIIRRVGEMIETKITNYIIENKFSENTLTGRGVQSGELVFVYNILLFIVVLLII